VWRTATRERRNLDTFADVTTRSRRLAGLAVAAALLGALAACASDGRSAPDVASQDATSSPGAPSTGADTSSGTPSATTRPETSADTTAPAVQVPEALQFSAPLVGGGEFTGADYADKPTVFWFWAPT
jgi:hypothetical protein